MKHAEWCCYDGCKASSDNPASVCEGGWCCCGVIADETPDELAYWAAP